MKNEKVDLGEKVMNLIFGILSLRDNLVDISEDSYVYGFRLESKFLSRVIEVIKEYVVVEIISVGIEKRKRVRLVLWIILKVIVKEDVIEKE